MNRAFFIIGAVILGFGLSACSSAPETPGVDPCVDCNDDLIAEGTHDTTPYEYDLPSNLPPLPSTARNITAAEVALGRHLFYDPILSSDSTLSCASCHKQELAFTDGQTVSTGVLGLQGSRNAMSLVNLAYNINGFFWDGREPTLESQALIPIEDHLEMNDTWENVEEKLRRHPTYPKMFKEAFGIERRSEITRGLATRALAQFERTLISGNSLYDQSLRLETFLPDDVERGRQLFVIEPADQSDEHPGCFHCHGAPHLTNNQFFNNGLDDVENLTDFPDLGRGAVTGNVYDNGKFRAPTLRNIALTAPYMHDGRFETLEEVLDHYAGGGHNVINEDPNIQPFTLTEQQKADMLAFLHALTDTSFTQNPAFSNPFED
mgnify:CR=1 FL=1